MTTTGRAPRNTLSDLRTQTMLVESWGLEVGRYTGQDGEYRHTLNERGRRISATLKAGEFLAYLTGFITATERRINPVLLRGRAA